MTDESKTYNWFNRNSWIFLCFAWGAMLIGSIWWYYLDRGFEPALAIASASVALISQIFARGAKGLFFIFGLFSGALLAGVLILIPRFNAEVVQTKLTEVQSEKQSVEKENTVLKTKIIELESATPTPTVPPVITQVPTPTITPSTSPTPEDGLARDFQNVRFEIASIKPDGNFLAINLKITSKNINRKVFIGGKDGARLIIGGTEYRARGAQIGSDRNSYGAESEVIREVPINAQIIFENLPNNTKIIEALEITVRVENNSDKFNFTNLKFK